MYFDPGFGSMLIQFVVAGIAAAGVTWTAMKGRMKGWFGKNSDTAGEDKGNADDEL